MSGLHENQHQNSRLLVFLSFLLSFVVHIRYVIVITTNCIKHKNVKKIFSVKILSKKVSL